jgi:uncharacterized membrane protein
VKVPEHFVLLPIHCPEIDMKINENKLLKRLSWVFIGVGLFTIIVFVFIAPFNDWSWQSDSSLFSDYGSFIGGFVGALFSLAGFFLIYLTLQAQQESISKQEDEIKAQKRAYDIESFESTFFNLLNVQQNITNDLKAYFYKTSGLTATENYAITGREFFRIAVQERFRISNALSSRKYVGVYNEDDNEHFVHELEMIEEQARLEHPDSFYYEEESGKLNKIRRLQLINKVYDITKAKWKEGRDTKDVDRVKFIYDLFFEKYHYAAGHYFRNLYHILKFVNTFEEAQLAKTRSTEEQKEIKDRCYQYTRFIQAQMSSPELALLHDNSLCFHKMLALVKKYHLVDNCSLEGLVYKRNFIE